MGDQLQLTVKTISGPVVELSVSKTVTVAALKALLCEKTQTAPEQQRLIYRGRVLKNEDLLTTYSLESGSVLHLVSRPPAHAPSSSGNDAASAAPSDAGTDLVTALGNSLPSWLSGAIERASEPPGARVEALLARLESPPSGTSSAITSTTSTSTTSVTSSATTLRIAAQLDAFASSLRSAASASPTVTDVALAARAQALGALLGELSDGLSGSSTAATTIASTTQRAPSGITPTSPSTSGALQSVLAQSVAALNAASNANLNGIIESVAPLLAGLSPAWRRVQSTYQPLVDHALAASGATVVAGSVNAAVAAATGSLPSALAGSTPAARSTASSTEPTSSATQQSSASTAVAAAVAVADDTSVWDALLRIVFAEITVPEVVRAGAGDWAPLQRAHAALRDALLGTASRAPQCALPSATALRRSVSPSALVGALSAAGADDDDDDAIAAAVRVAQHAATTLSEVVLMSPAPSASRATPFADALQRWAASSVRDLTAAVRARFAPTADVQPLLRHLLGRALANGASAPIAVMINNMVMSYVARELLGAAPATATPVSIASNAQLTTAPTTATTTTTTISTSTTNDGAVSADCSIAVVAALGALPVAWREQVAIDIAQQARTPAQPPLSPIYLHGPQ